MNRPPLFPVTLALSLGATVTAAPAQTCCESGAACSPTGSATCGAGGFIPSDPVTEPAARSGPSPQDLGLIDLDPMLEPIRAVYRVPGLSAALVRDGHLAALGAVGIRRVGSPQRLELDDPFHLGSCGKAVTASVAARMVDRGLIGWETTIGESFPDLAATMHPQLRAVTLRDLLRHRGGLASRSESFDEAISGFTGTIRERRRALVRFATASAPYREPGTEFGYTDVGYAIAGTMLEAAAHRSWEMLVVELVAEPLRLETLGFGAPGRDDPGSAPRGHVLTSDGLAALGTGPGADLADPAIGPAGTIHMSIGDWATFASFHLEGARGKKSTLLSAEGFATLHGDPLSQGYALGWFVTANQWGAGGALTHTGSCGAWAALIWVMPKQNAALVAATNFGGGAGYRALQLAAEQIGERFLSPSEPGAEAGPTPPRCRRSRSRLGRVRENPDTFRTSQGGAANRGR